MRAKLVFAERLTARDGLPRLHKHAGKPRIGADAFIRLPDFDAPAPKLVADTGEYHAVAHADGGFSRFGGQVHSGMRLPAVKTLPEYGLRGEAANLSAGDGANGTGSDGMRMGASVGTGMGLICGVGEEETSGAGAAACTFC